MSMWMVPVDRDASEKPCECCAKRGLHLYRSDCLRCFARDMARGVPRIEREKRNQLAKRYDAEWMATLRRMVGEERNKDIAAGYGRYGHAERVA